MKDMEKEISNALAEVNPQLFKSLIHEFRGTLVMLDSDLAAIYGYSTKDFNRQVKNNREKFAEDFMFQLTKEEADVILRCKNFTSSLVESDLAYQQIYSAARKSVIVYDNYISLKTLVLMKNISAEVSVTVVTDNVQGKLSKAELTGFRTGYISSAD